MTKQLITQEAFVNVQEAQAGLSKLLVKAKKNNVFYRVMKSGKPVGVLLTNEMWEDYLEDMEAASSENFKRRIAKLRKDTKMIEFSEVVKRVLGDKMD